MAQPYSFRSRKTQIKGNESYKMQMMMVATLSGGGTP